MLQLTSAHKRKVDMARIFEVDEVEGWVKKTDRDRHTHRECAREKERERERERDT